MRLRMAELADPSVQVGSRLNPIMREVRSTILAIDKVLTETMKAYRENKKISKDDINIATSQNYYEMLLTEPEASVEAHNGVSH